MNINAALIQLCRRACTRVCVGNVPERGDAILGRYVHVGFDPRVATGLVLGGIILGSRRRIVV